MGTKAVLIIGGSGFLGTHLALKLRESHKVYATYHTRPLTLPGVTALPMDLARRDWVQQVLKFARPETVIHAAGVNDPEWAELHPTEAEVTHAEAPVSVSNATELQQPRFIYLSNHQVFDGNRGNYREIDTLLPVNTLGKVKMGGENFVRGRFLNYAIVRSSPLFGRGNGRTLTFFDQLRIKLAKDEPVELPASELHSFAYVGAFTEFISRLLESGVRNRVLHFGGLTKTTFYELGRSFASRFGYDPKLLIPSRSGTATHGPLDFSLNSSQAAETLKIKPLLLEESFDLVEQQLIPSL